MTPQQFYYSEFSKRLPQFVSGCGGRIMDFEMRVRLLENQVKSLQLTVESMAVALGNSQDNILSMSRVLNSLATSVDGINWKVVELKNLNVQIENYIQLLNEKYLTLEKGAIDGNV